MEPSVSFSGNLVMKMFRDQLKNYTKSSNFYKNLPFRARNHGNLETIVPKF